MIKKILLATALLLFLNGCGSGPTSDDETTINTPTINNIEKKDYNLWEYMVPTNDRVNSFSLYNNDETKPSETYTTSYKVYENLVEESSSYAPDEKTIYEKKDNEIVVSFQKDNSIMGFFTLELQANIDDMVTKKASDCKLEKHYPLYNDKFSDVIEIVCGNQHGFYQKNVGEISQIAQDETSKKVRILSN